MRKNIISLLFSLLIITIYSQTNPGGIIQNSVNSIAPKSPDAAALFRYTETPVSLYTGVPEINIPIYTIKDGDVEVPISISYHAGGIKVTDEASSVGLGWSLNAGGRVSQIVAGSNDFNMYGYYNIYPKNASGYAGSIQSCPTVPWNTSTQSNTYYTNEFSLSNANVGTYAGMDVQPDLFLINLPNNTHKAYLDMTKTTKTDFAKFAFAGQSNIDFKIKPVGSGFVPDSYGNYNFSVVDEKGISYSFDGTKEISIPLVGTYGAITGVSKYLTKIEDPAGNKVNFFYTSNLQSERLAGCRNTRAAIKFAPIFNGTIADIKENGLTNCSKQIIDESFIDKIEFSEGSVEFNWSDRDDVNRSKKLSSIKIYNKYKLIKQYDFTYDYFVATDNLDTNQLVTWLNSNPLISWSGATNKIFTHRLKLLSITESITNEKYTFDYNTTYNLPNKLSFSSDFWGYYNGQNNSDTFIPDPSKYLKGQPIFNVTSFNNDQSGYWYSGTTVPPAIDLYDSSQRYINFSADGKHYLSDRRASLASLAGILTSISYPTGGKTEFEYEPNTFSNFPLQSLLDITTVGISSDYSFGGGIRIKNITTTEKIGAIPVIKSYIYDELVDNGTKKISYGNLAELPKFYEIENRCFKKADGGFHYMGQPQDVFSVITSEPGCFLNSGNFKLSLYEGLPSQGVSTLPQGKHIGYSKVVEKVVGKGKTEYYYVNDYTQSCLSMKSRGETLLIGDGDLSKQMFYNNNNDLIKETVFNYKKNYQDNLNTYFISASILEPVTRFIARPIAVLSDGNVGFSGETRINEPVAGLIHSYTINLYKSLLDYTTTKEYFPPGSNNYLETKNYNTYNNKYLLSKQLTKFPNLSTSEINYKYAAEVGDANMIAANMIAIPLETNVVEDGTVQSKTKIVYSKNAVTSNKILPTSVLSYNQIDLNNINNQNPTPTSDIIYKQYDANGNLQEYTTKAGITTAIVWGYNNTKPIAKIQGVQYSQLGYTVNDIIAFSNYDAFPPINKTAYQTETELQTKLNEFRTNPLLSAYQISTYSYDPLIGVRSMTPPSGITEYYRYDTTNRLEMIVDVNGDIIKEFKYNYQHDPSLIFYNDLQSKTFARTNCGPGYLAGTYNYIVPANIFSSNISKLAANQEAFDDIELNGQNVTNQNGSCLAIITCPFTFSTIVGTPMYSYGNTTVVNSNVQFDLKFSAPTMYGQSWTSGINIGKVGASCIPSVTRNFDYTETEGTRKWNITIDTTGNCTMRLTLGTINTNSNLVFWFKYDK